MSRGELRGGGGNRQVGRHRGLPVPQEAGEGGGRVRGRGAVLRVAPGRTESVPAANSAAFNVRVSAGSLLGGALRPVVRVRGAFPVGGPLTAGALASLIRPQPRDSPAGVRTPVVPAE
ncbi:hypothetical protein [Streptomyces sp. NPDC001137]|uniref:hypothetical protein n=1 Tax=Streptomyces sp. NPDC001137 TaxID=3154378 RepID=UPI003319F1A6